MAVGDMAHVLGCSMVCRRVPCWQDAWGAAATAVHVFVEVAFGQQSACTYKNDLLLPKRAYNAYARLLQALHVQNGKTRSQYRPCFVFHSTLHIS
jgi:hypothetical protein